MIKLFISQPMRGKTDKQILDERESAVQAVLDMVDDDVGVIDSFFTGTELGKPLAYLGESLKLMSEADFVYFAPGWENARGCLIERMCCSVYGIPVIGETD